MKRLTRDDILAATELDREEVEVPEWGGVVMVRALTAAERDDFEASCIESKGKSQGLTYQNLRAKLVVRSLVDAEGTRIFKDGDAAALGKCSASAVQRVFAVAQRLSRLTAEDVEELAGN